MAKRTVQQIKDDMGYKTYGPSCSNCKHFTSTFETPFIEKNKRCIIGCFVVGKAAWCSKHEFK